MKKIGLLLIILLSGTFMLSAQNIISAKGEISSSNGTLSESPRSSSEVLVYRLSRDDSRKIFLKGSNPDESMLHTLVGSYDRRVDKLPLERGNYIVAGVENNKLLLETYTVDDFQFRFIGDEDVSLFLSDNAGNPICDAVVKKGAKKIRYDHGSGLYEIGEPAYGKVLEVDNGGVVHYIEIDKVRSYYSQPFRYKVRDLWYGVKKLFDGDRIRYKYEGFVVFSKPKYKPGETVKFKGYVADRKSGKPYNREAEVRLRSWRPQIDTLLAVLKPYSPGMYEYEFGLSDSLNLRLDADYRIEIVTGPNTNDIGASFRYEEYELQGVEFNAVADKSKYVRGDTVRITLGAVDENGLAIYDGRATLTLKSLRRSGRSYDYYADNVFVPDTLWREEVDMAGMSEKEIVIAPSVFPADAAVMCDLTCEFFTSDNEKHSARLKFLYDANPHSIEFSMDKGMITVAGMSYGESQQTDAKIIAYDANGEVLSQEWEQIRLPYTFPAGFNVYKYRVRTPLADGDFVPRQSGGTPFECHFARQDENVVLKVDNPAQIPLWYEVRRDKRIIDSGHEVSGFEKIYSGKKEDSYALRVKYPTASGFATVQEYIPYEDKSITLDVSTPAVVYPGQSAGVEVSVTDRRGKPVEGADITAYAFTSKFGTFYPSMKIHGTLKRSGFESKKYRYSGSEGSDSAVEDVDWVRWRYALGLDSLEYYRFLHPAGMYIQCEPDSGGNTVISPYVVVDGKLQKVHVLWIDEQPHYFSNADQRYNYYFDVSPGRHSFRVRTADRIVSVSPVMIQKGMRTLFSIESGRAGLMSISPNAITYDSDVAVVSGNGRAAVAEDTQIMIEVFKNRRKGKGELTESETAVLGEYMIGIDRENLETFMFPGNRARLDVPGYITHGNMVYQPTDKQFGRSLLVGPFPLRNSSSGNHSLGMYSGGRRINTFIPEAGYDYTVRNGYLKLTSWDGGLKRIPRFLAGNAPEPVFGGLLTGLQINSEFRDRFFTVMETTSGIVNPEYTNRGDMYCQLQIELGEKTDGTAVTPALIYFPAGEGMAQDKYLYYGKTREFGGLPEGEIDMMLVFRDGTVHTEKLDLKSGGVNYYRIDPISPVSDTLYVHLLDVVAELGRTVYAEVPGKRAVPPKYSGGYYFSGTVNNVVTGTVTDNSGETIIGATVQLKGTNIAVATDINGRYYISAPGNGVLIFSSVGAKEKRHAIRGRSVIDVVLGSANEDLESLVFIGYGSGAKIEDLARSGDYSSEVVGRVAGIQSWSTGSGEGASIRVRGISSISLDSAPLYIVDGVPVGADVVNSLDAADIVSMNVIKDGSAVAIYGSRAAGGVVYVTTRRGLKLQTAGMQPDDSAGMPFFDAASGIRRNFHDDAFWQPSLRTGPDGKVRFEVTYPDDVTSWNAGFIAIGNRRQTDFKQLKINSFKALTAHLSVPAFMVEGDSLSAIGRLTNYRGDTIKVETVVAVDGLRTEREIEISKSHIENIPIFAAPKDSLTVTYSMTMENGYTDGEERKIPVYKKGVLETYGQFALINDDSTRIFATNLVLGAVTVNAEASAFGTLLEEIEKLYDYPYFCNEQTASKLKGLIARKRIYAHMGEKFDDGREIRALISRLERNRNSEGLWGWWNRETTNWWMSVHILEALMEAEKEGYKIDIDKSGLISRFVMQLGRYVEAESVQDKWRMFDMLVLLKDLGAEVDFGMWFSAIDAAGGDLQRGNSNMLRNNITPTAKAGSIYSQVKSIYIKTAVGQADSTDIEKLKKLSRKTVMGSVFWGENLSEENRYVPAHTDIEITLMAYKALRFAGCEELLADVRNYFFENRKRGLWSNTYEAARIVETILPDIVAPVEIFEDPVMTINGTRVVQFPYTAQFAPGESLTVGTTGDAPLFFTCYQQEWNADPAGLSEGISVKSIIKENGRQSDRLTAGGSAQIEVTVNVESSADYIMIEIPIPSGCSYVKKSGFWPETHREYFKDRVAIFCRDLPRGEHSFIVELTPRYTGEYYLNPAKAELMYFPTFRGHEGIKRIAIE